MPEIGPAVDDGGGAVLVKTKKALKLTQNVFKEFLRIFQNQFLNIIID